MKYQVEEIIFKAGVDIAKVDTVKTVGESSFPFHAIDLGYNRSLKTENLIEIVDSDRNHVIATFN